MFKRFSWMVVCGLATAVIAVSCASGAGQNQSPSQKETGKPPLDNPLHITKHNITVELDPETHSFKGKDLVTVDVPSNDVPLTTTYYFILHPQLTLKSLTSGNKGSALKFKQYSSPNDYTVYTFNFPVDRLSSNGTVELECVYEGQIYDPVESEKTLGFIRGGQTSGVIGKEGIYLHHGTAWYPRTALQSMIQFEVTAITPVGWEVVGQDELKERIETGEKNDKIRTTWTSPVAFDSYTLVGGQYVVTAEAVKGVRVATYFRKESQQFAQAHLDSAKEFIALYSEALTPYPFKSFSVVESFFTAGYGMPSYTLLGSDVIMMGRHANEGGLGHEIMHCWWGNYVNVDEADGNWCEGLTSYCSNYYYLELKKTRQDAQNYRRNTNIKFSAYVNDQNDYPVREFKSKGSEQDSEIGYGKASMVFHMIRQMIGNEAFFNGLRLVIKEHGAGKASWRDFQSAFERTAGKKSGEFDWFFTQWLGRKGAPELALEDVSSQKASDDQYQVSFVLKQSNKVPFKLSIPLVLTTDAGQLTHTLELSSPTHRMTIPAPKGTTKLIALTLDPEYNLFRRLNRAELAPCLGMTLSDQNLMLVYPSGGTPEENTFYQQLTERVKSTRPVTAKADKDVTEADLKSNSLLLLGHTKINGVTAKLPALLTNVSSNFSIQDGNFTVQGASYQEAKYALMVSERNPYNADKYLTVFFGLSPAAAHRPGRIIFFYRWDQYLIFEDGRMSKQGSFAPPLNALEYKFTASLPGGAGSTATIIDGSRIKQHAEYLASDKLQGRAVGSKGGVLAAEYITNEFKKYGLKPLRNDGVYLQPFYVTIQKLDKDNSLTIDGKPLTIGNHFLPFSFSGKAIAAGNFTDCPLMSAGYGITAPEQNYDDYKDKDAKGKVVLLQAGLPESASVTATKYATAFYKVTNAKAHGAKAVLICANTLDSTEAVWEEFPSVDIRKRLASEETKVRNVALRTMVLSAQSRLQSFPDLDIGIPAMIISLKPETIKDGSVVSINYKTASDTVYTGNNVVALLEGGDPALKKDALVIGAHYDHLGAGQDGKYFLGANDNASGIGGLLGIAEALAKQLPKRSVIFVAFDGEEWGLWGSRYSAQFNLISLVGHQTATTSAPLIDKQLAMLNMDMIGRGSLGELYVMGKVFNPGLYEIADKVNTGLNLNIKTNIDFLFKYGSDHASFHQAKVPALNFTSGPFEDEHTVGDTADKLVPEKMGQIASLVYLTALEIANSNISFPAPKDIEVSPPRTGRGHPGGAKQSMPPPK